MAIKQELPSRQPVFSKPSLQEFGDAMSAKDNYDYSKHELYPRDGFPDLDRLEKHLATLVGVGETGHVLLTTTGMSAINTAIEIANPTKDDVIMHGNQLYSKTQEIIQEDLRERGVKPVAMGIADVNDIGAKIVRHKPRVIFFETISNGTQMEILDVEEFLKLPVLHDIDPLIILDNTLPTDSNLPLASLIKDSGLRIIGVESGTKSYFMNQDLAGFVFTCDKELADRLIRRRRRGDHPGKALVEKLQGIIPPTKEQFDRENRKIASNTLELAMACSEVAQEKDIFAVAHPNLPDHPQADLAKKLYPNGASPVFFIYPAWGLDNILVKEIALSIERALLANGLKPDADFYIAQSFGLRRTSFQFEERKGYVRVAGGLESREELLCLKKAFQEGLAALI